MRRRRRETPEVLPGVPPMNPRWERILRGDSRLARAQRLYRRMFSLIPSPWRCKFCNAPFSGPHAGALKWIGYAPSAKNPNVCAR
jgi:adenylate cyclase